MNAKVSPPNEPIAPTQSTQANTQIANVRSTAKETQAIASEPATNSIADNANPDVSTNKIADGDYRDGLDSGESGLEVQGAQYRHTSEEGAQDWRSIRGLKFVKAGVVLDEENHHWCLSSLMPPNQDRSQRAVCSENGWVPMTVKTTAVDRKLLFSCSAENGKQILLYDSGKTIDYTFGKPNETPELSLQAPRSEASTWQWAGIGRWMNYFINVPNGDTTYSVFWGVDRLSSEHSIEAGVNVFINQKNAATVKCSSDIINNMEGVDLKKQELAEN